MKSLLKFRGKYNRLNIELLVIVHLSNGTRKHTKALFQYKFSIQILKYPSYLPKNVFTTQKLVLTLFHPMSIWGNSIPHMAGIIAENGADIPEG